MSKRSVEKAHLSITAPRKKNKNDKRSGFQKGNNQGNSSYSSNSRNVQNKGKNRIFVYFAN